MYLIFSLGQINYYEKGSLGCTEIEAVCHSITFVCYAV